MSLAAGTRLAHYEILEPIGKGGMGEVYRAKDSKLGRDVAIKVLPDEFPENAERLARFKREAKVLASLNHPNIASIYGLEQSESTHYLVLELVPGETLAERISRGPVPLEEALDIATQMAEALEEAHEQGIVHRDLKPANVKQTEDGKIKVLDYGLAKVFQEETPDADSSMSPTLTRDATRVGVILGTAAYMSPEQAKGKKVDKRTDIFAFGAVLYEMLTGKKAFPGEDVSEVLASVIKLEPDWKALPAGVSSRLLDLLRRCLEKDSKRRVRDIGDVRLAMEGAFETTAAQQGGAVSQSVGWRPSMSMAAAAGLLLSIVASVAVWNLKPEAPRPLVRSFVNPPSMPPNLDPPDVDVAITPDGTRIVYVALVDGRQLVVRALDEIEATPLGGLGDNPRGVFISPDGNWVGYFADGLQKVSILGGPPVTICDVSGAPRGASWGDDDTIVFATSGPGGLWRVPAGGGEPEELTTPDLEQGDHRWPEILPGSTAVLFTIMGGSVEGAQIAVLSLDSGETKILIPGGSNPRYAPTGHIAYGVGGTLRAVGFDLKNLEVTSDPIPVLDGVITKSSGAANFGMSQSGSLAYVAGPERSGVVRTLVWVDREGREEALAAEPRTYHHPRVSPDGTRLALDVDDQELDIWIWHFARETLTRLTFDPAFDFVPAWTPDGLQVAFGSNRDGVFSTFWKAADGTGTVERLIESANGAIPMTFSPDGTQLVFIERHPETGSDLYARSMDADGASEPLLVTEFNERNAEISPDGHWLAYQSNASGQNEIYVRPFPNIDDGRWQISRGGGTKPLWGPDGRELFYLSLGGQLTAVPTEADGSFTFGNPEVVFEETYYFRGPPFLGRTYDISPDGKRFLMIKEGGPGDETEPTQLILVLNWFEELKRLVPTDN